MESPAMRPPPAYWLGDGGGDGFGGSGHPSENELRAILDSSADAIIVVDSRGVLRYANPAADRLFGRDLQALRGTGFGFPTAPGRTEIDVLPPGEKPRVAEMHVTSLTWEHEAASLAILRDVTERKAMEDELRLAAQVFDNASEGLLITDAGQRVLKVNPAFLSITGYEPGEVYGRPMGDLLDSELQDPALPGDIEAGVREDGRWEGELIKRRRDGTACYTWTTVIAVRDEAEQPTHFIVTFEDITRWKEAERRLDHLAHADPLTDLPNRNAFHQHLDLALGQARRHGDVVAVLFLDLDHFKPVNDALGHSMGDEILQAVARRLRETVRGSDLVARLGGDEFIVLVRDIQRAADAAVVAQKVIDQLSTPFELYGHEIHIGCSVGIAMFPDDGRDGDGLIHRADQAMYRAKDHGRGLFAFAGEAEDRPLNLPLRTGHSADCS
ncbi:diguanylate cyclase domain-containing protein [Thioalkalivibrio sp. ALJ24]|uniref:diguanylate cyclase domain-containing protein n=1 Tax=Thioalkalivibrio sp. ALJ24 TaxID=545276 RepID=UPI0003750BF4